MEQSSHLRICCDLLGTTNRSELNGKLKGKKCTKSTPFFDCQNFIINYSMTVNSLAQLSKRLTDISHQWRSKSSIFESWNHHYTCRDLCRFPLHSRFKGEPQKTTVISIPDVQLADVFLILLGPKLSLSLQNATSVLASFILPSNQSDMHNS